MKVKVTIDGRDEAIELVRTGDRVRITRDGQSRELRLLYRSGPYFVLEYEDWEGGRLLRKRLRAAGTVNGDRRQLWVNGRYLIYERRREGRAAGGGAAGSLAASIPAVVADVLVQPGDAVVAGQKLLLLESMKMVIPIQAPHDGQVTAVHCRAGEAVQPGVPLVELEAED